MVEIDYEKALDEKLENLKQCQSAKNHLESNNAQGQHKENKKNQGCFACEELLECAIRREYVSAVYKSMNKGQGGEFEF